MENVLIFYIIWRAEITSGWQISRAARGESRPAFVWTEPTGCDQTHVSTIKQLKPLTSFLFGILCPKKKNFRRGYRTVCSAQLFIEKTLFF